MRSFRISPTEHTPAATSRQGRYFAAEAAVGNAAGPWAGSVTTHAAKVGGGAGGADLVRTSVTATRIGPALQVLVYDDDGNLASDGLWDYQWDAENRLVRVATSAAAVAAGYPAQLWEYRYDYQGRRVMKRDVLAAGSERRHLFVGWNVVAEFTWNAATSTLSLNRTFTWGLDLAGSFGATGGVGALLQIRDETQSKTLLPAYDGNGNVTALLDATTGAPAATYEYDPFGRLLRAEGSYAKDNTYRFSTKWHDDETGLVYYGHRSYSPALGRFINRDPIEEAGGLNLYAFAGNDGVNRWDYLGMNWTDVWNWTGTPDSSWEHFSEGAGGYFDHSNQKIYHYGAEPDPYEPSPEDITDGNGNPSGGGLFGGYSSPFGDYLNQDVTAYLFAHNQTFGAMDALNRTVSNNITMQTAIATRGVTIDVDDAGYFVLKTRARSAPNSADKGLGKNDVQSVTVGGKQVGSVQVVTYVSTPNGLQIVLGYKDAGSGLTDFNWVQTIRTNKPLGGATSPYNDPQPPDDKLPFYWTNAELPGYTNKNGFSVIFSDRPGRGGDANWQAELSLVGKNGSGGYQPLQTFTYGFDITTGKVTLKPLETSTPTDFQNKSIPGYKGP